MPMLVPMSIPLEPAPSILHSKQHPSYPLIKLTLDPIFLHSWPTPTGIAKYRKADFNAWTCYAFPEGGDERVLLACELLTLDFLIDDHFDTISPDEALLLTSRLSGIIRLDSQPDAHTNPTTNTAIESLHWDLWSRIWRADPHLAAPMSEAQIELLQYSVHKDRSQARTWKSYLDFREIDGGMPLTCALHYFVAGVRLSDAEKEVLRPVERLASNHICIVNDILSWDKEVRQRAESGAVVVNAVEVVMRERGVCEGGAKGWLWGEVRRWEREYAVAMGGLEGMLRAGKIDGRVCRVARELEWRMAGGERWTRESERYRQAGQEGKV